MSNGYYHKDMLPFVYLWIAMLMTCTFLMHVQVMIRFFSSLLPFFWFMGHIVRESSSRSSQDTFGKSEGILRNIWASLLLKYFFLAATVHTILFACFYPPA